MTIFGFISHYRLSHLLFPTLISACYQVSENVQILEQEISCKLLVAFLQETLARQRSKDEQADTRKKQGESFFSGWHLS